MSTRKRILFNMNWDLDTNGVRKLELDALKGLNSNINNLGVLYSPIDGTTNKSDITLFLARKRLIHLMDSWNRILNSGLFLEGRIATAQPNSYYKIVGSNVRSPSAEYLFKDWNISGTYHYKLDFKTESIFYRMVRFLVACVNNHNWFVSNNISKSSFFNLTGIGIVDMVLYINTNFNPTSAKFLATMEGFLGILKELIQESNLVSKLGITLDSLTYLTPEGRTNIMALDGYKSNYPALAKIELDYLNPEPKALAQEWIQGSSSNVKLLWPQFGTLINRNITGPGEEAWSFRNVLIDTSDYDQFAVDPLMDPLLKKYQPRYIACSQVDMKKPLVFGTQFINWSNDMDQPYIMSYNGGTLIHLPDEIKDPIQVVDYERLNPDYTINNNYLYLPILPTGTKAIEFTLITDDTTYFNSWGRKIIGPSSAITTYENGICIAGGNYNEISWVNSNGTKRVFFVENGNYKNQTIKIKLENTDTGSNIYKNDILISTASVKFDFNSWAIGCTDVNRYSTGISITNLTYYYSIGNYLGEQPDNQLNLAANFWSIGTANDLDPNYKPTDDIKLKSIPELHNLDKLDYLDNLTLYLKLN